MAEEQSTGRSFHGLGEELMVVFVILVFVVTNLAVITHTPTVGVDEPEHCDPAANLYFGNGFTSTMWGQERAKFAATNELLYQGFLYLSFRSFGFGLAQARAVNLVLAAAAATLIWWTVRRASLIRYPSSRLVMLGCILSGFVSTLTFRTARYDTTMFFICSLVFTSWYSHRRRSKLLLIGFSSFLLPAAGLPMIPYAFIMSVIYLILIRKEVARVLASTVGIIFGVVALLFVYSQFHVLHSFFAVVSPSTTVGTATRSRLIEKIYGNSMDRDNLVTCFFGDPREILDPKVMFDYSAFILFVAFAYLSRKRWDEMTESNKRAILFVITTAIVVPPFMHMVGHYRSYYRWMTYMILAVGVPWVLENGSRPNKPDWAIRVVKIAVAGSIFLGVPFRTLAALPSWRSRSIRPLTEAAAIVARSNDVVVSYFNTYFAVKPKVKIFYAYGITASGQFDRTKDLPTNQISLLCLRTNDLPGVLSVIGGKWNIVSLPESDREALQKTRYAVEFYRRAD